MLTVLGLIKSHYNTLQRFVAISSSSVALHGTVACWPQAYGHTYVCTSRDSSIQSNYSQYHILYYHDKLLPTPGRFARIRNSVRAVAQKVHEPKRVTELLQVIDIPFGLLNGGRNLWTNRIE